MQFLTDRIIHHEEQNNEETARKVRNIAKAEARMEEHKEVKTATKDFSNKINHITIPDTSNATGFKNIYDKEEIEKEMLSAHKIKFTERYDTASLMEPLTSILGPIGLTPTCNDILKGDHKFPPCIHPDIIEFFSHMSMPKVIRDEAPVKSDMPSSYYKYYWKPSRERTSSSFSGIHNGHYITATQSEYLTNVTTLLCDLPWKIGYSPIRWQQSLNVELEKIPGIRLLSKLRTIHLLEADFNMGTKTLVGQRVMKHAKKHKLVP
jgi:hypothetical protein